MGEASLLAMGAVMVVIPTVIITFYFIILLYWLLYLALFGHRKN